MAAEQTLIPLLTGCISGGFSGVASGIVASKILYPELILKTISSLSSVSVITQYSILYSLEKVLVAVLISIIWLLLN